MISKMASIKVYIPERTNLNEETLKAEFEIVDTMAECDYAIVQSTLPWDYDKGIGKTIYIAVEPPLADHRLFCYSKFNEFPLVVTHNPQGDNQIPFTSSDKPQYYPVNPTPNVVPFYTREDTTLTNRGVFYAGMIHTYEEQPDDFGAINITVLRRELGDYLEKEFPASKIIGRNRNGQTTKVSNWREDKANQIKDSGCDFVLALENMIFPNYLYEKIWDGFASDRVTLYLGDPNIEKHIPLDCFVDLRKWFNKETKEFDFDGLGNYLKGMTQEEYDTIVRNARVFRETAKGKYTELRDELTKQIIDYINLLK